MNVKVYSLKTGKTKKPNPTLSPPPTSKKIEIVKKKDARNHQTGH